MWEGHLASLAIMSDRVESVLHKDLMDLLGRVVSIIVTLNKVEFRIWPILLHSSLEQVVMDVLEGLDFCNECAILLHVISNHLLALRRDLVLCSPCNREL